MMPKPERKHRCVYEAQAKITLSSSGPKKQKNKPQINKDFLVDFLQSRHTKGKQRAVDASRLLFFFPSAFTNKWLHNWRAGLD